MDFGEVLSRAWKIIWKHKVLWIFGILGGCGGVSRSGGSNTSFQINDGELPSEFRRFFSPLTDFFRDITDGQIVLLVVSAFLAALIIVVLVIILSTVGRIGVILGTLQVEKGAERLEFRKLFSEGFQYFWRILGLNLLFGIAGFVLLMILIVPFTLLTILTLGIGLLCLLPFLCLLIPLGWLISVILEQANIAIVVENIGILAGLQRGWEVFRENLGTMIVMALILMIGGGLAGFIITLPLILVAIPVLFGFLANSSIALGGSLIIFGLGFLIYIPILVILNGILRSYIGSAWTLTYLNITGALVEINPLVSLPEDL